MYGEIKAVFAFGGAVTEVVEGSFSWGGGGGGGGGGG